MGLAGRAASLLVLVLDLGVLRGVLRDDEAFGVVVGVAFRAVGVCGGVALVFVLLVGGAAVISGGSNRFGSHSNMSSAKL